MPYLPAEGDIAQAFDAALAHRKGRSEHFALHRRAMLAPAGDRAGYLDHAMAHKKRKELRRQRKRLADTGALTSTSEHRSGSADGRAGWISWRWKPPAGKAAPARRSRNSRVFWLARVEVHWDRESVLGISLVAPTYRATSWQQVHPQKLLRPPFMQSQTVLQLDLRFADRRPKPKTTPHRLHGRYVDLRM